MMWIIIERESRNQLIPCRGPQSAIQSMDFGYSLPFHVKFFLSDGGVPSTLVIASCEVVKPRVATAEHISQFSKEFLDDMDDLQCLHPTHQPCVSDHMNQIKDKIVQEACTPIGIFFLLVKSKTSMRKIRKHPKNRDDREYIDDPNDVKPEGYDSIPAKIPDPKAKERILNGKKLPTRILNGNKLPTW